MKKNRILFFLLLIGMSFSVYAKKVEIADARLVAKNTFFEQANRHNAVPYETIAITNEFVEKYNNHDVYYVFNMNDKGFVIISADDICYPVIGFSFESSYSPSNQAAEFTYWMNNRKKEISDNIENNIQPDAKATSMWQHLNNKDFNKSPNIPESTLDVTPLLTSLWDQEFPYNNECPADASCSAFNGHVTTGCIATAMAQIMYYWRWPNTGTGSHCYYTIRYGQLCANFDTTFDWNGMVNQPTTENLPIELLMSDCGISVNMNYNSDGQCSSGAYLQDVPGALVNYFRYSSTAVYYAASSYSTTSWNNMLQADLNIGEVIQYAGSGSAGGHSWVCDGYQATDYYHFNWGWSGSDNGYYYLNNLDPGGESFTSDQAAVFHITPDPSLYPVYCSGNTNVTTDDLGTIEDGSGPVANYQNNSNCSWLIAPDDSVSSIRLGFIRFNTAPSDILTVYDGPTTSSPVLGTFSGANLPTVTPTSTGPQMLVTFVSTSSSTTQNGFLLSYTSTPVPFCSNNTTLTDATGSLSDGSGRFQYRNSTSCKWFIQPPNALSITVTFTDFNTEADNDKLLIYNAAGSATLLATISGAYTTPPSPVTIPSGKAMILWSSNTTIRGAGWDATYNAVLDETNNMNAIKDISVFPNPTDGLLNIQFNVNQLQSSVSLEIISLTGETVYRENLGSFQGSFDKQLDLSSFAKGIYILRLSSDSGSTNKKIVVN